MYDYSLAKNWTELHDGVKPYRVLFVHYAPEGAQGHLWNSAYIVYDTGEVFFVDFNVTGIGYLPMVDEWQRATDDLIPQGWAYQYMGAFNHLFISKRVEKRFRELTSSFEKLTDYYLNWLEIALSITAELNETRCARRASCKLHNNLVVNGHTAINLGLSVRWASCNVGAASPGDYGDYFAWGEVAPKEVYTPDNYQFLKAERHNCAHMEDDISATAHDVAHELWGNGWRMPTTYEFNELLTECTWKWVVRKRTGCLRFSEGYQITGPNGNSIFLPAAWLGMGTSIPNRIPNACGYYWSCWLNVYFDSSAQCLFFSKNAIPCTFWEESYLGLPVRPVIE